MKSPSIIALAIFAVVTPATAAVHLSEPLFEQREAKVEEARILRAPIAGVENKYWFNYRGNVNEAQKELASDVGRATDIEDLRDAWDEYRVELADTRHDYVKKMVKHGYRVGSVIAE